MQCARSQIASLMMLLVVGATWGCGGADKPCMSMGSMSEVLGRAAIVRLDVYDANAHCDGATVADGAAPPTMSKVAAAGQPIKLDVPAGRHVLLLSAFGDAMRQVAQLIKSDLGLEVAFVHPDSVHGILSEVVARG